MILKIVKPLKNQRILHQVLLKIHNKKPQRQQNIKLDNIFVILLRNLNLIMIDMNLQHLYRV
jgi:hypothetical protein